MIRKDSEQQPIGGYFVDPWFDGSNYACTIVATPNRGTMIEATGTASDLSDDRVALLVQQELELSVFASEVTVRDLAGSAVARPVPERTLQVAEALRALSAPPRSCYRFARVALEDHVQTLEAGMAAQIGRVLWRILDPDGSEGLPDEALARHLVVDAESVSVWSRRGVVIAEKARSDSERSDELGRHFAALAQLARDVGALLEGFDLRLMSSLNDVSGIPTKGKNLIIVAAVNNVLHFRIFDGDGKEVVDTDEKRLAEQTRQIEDSQETTRELVASPRDDGER